MPHERKWRAFPLHVYEQEGEEFVLTTSRDQKLATEATAQIVNDIELHRSRNDEERVKLAELTLARHKRNVEILVERTETLRSQAVEHRFELAKPTYGEFLDAEELSKDWVNGEPRVNESKLSLVLLQGHVKLDGEVFDDRAVRDLSPEIGSRLWNELKAMAYPNPERLPFLNSHSTT